MATGDAASHNGGGRQNEVPHHQQQEGQDVKASINGISINYSVSGKESAPAVVLHHPLGTNLTVWNELTRQLEHDYRIIRFDARGHGATDAPEGAYDFQTLARDTIGVMDHVGVKRAHYLGLSMGGFVGQFLALDFPARFRSMTLVSTSSNMSAGREIWDQRIRDVTENGMTRQIIDVALTRWVSPAALEGRPDLVERLRRMLEATPAAGYAGWCHAIRDLNVTERLNGIHLPTRVIVGVLDPATPVAAAEVIHREIRGSELVRMPGVSHMLMLEAPEAFHAHVMPFLAKHNGC